MTYIDKLTDILAVMVLEYLRAESQRENADSAINQTGQNTKSISAGTDELAS